MVGFFFSGLFLILGVWSVWPFVNFGGSLSLGLTFGGVFCVDQASYCLGLLSILIGVSLSYWVWDVSIFSRWMLLVSIFFSLLCYSCVNAFWFWVFYELSIVPLLILLAVDSPYSERYVALWYFAGYIVLGSLPMLLCLIYFSEVGGSFDLREWSIDSNDCLHVFIGALLGFLFITKIPLIPFHVWLPIVHAEASSPVSVCLSGYIMKLGLLGVFRFCLDLFPLFIFTWGYMVLCLLASLFFFISAVRELDMKRWLAFFSLGHIVVAVSCLSLGGWKVSYLGFVYCLGHGLSAASMFLFIWLVSLVSGTRNIMLLKSGLLGGLVFRVCFCFVVGTVCCVPPTVQFFSEVFLMSEFVWLSNSLLPSLLYFYVFCGGLIPVVLMCILLSRQYDLSYVGGGMMVRVCSVILLILWSFLLFVVC